MKNKKIGFTLIELLAVIIVLAIIALIATPIIFNVIENAKIKSLENSCYGVIDAVRTNYSENLLNSTRECKDENDKNCGGKIETNGNVEELTVAGEQPSGGSWVIVNDPKAENGRGIQITDVTFDSMKGYFCSNDLTTGKVKCEKDDANLTLEPIQATVEVGMGTDKSIEEYFTFAKTGRGASTLSCKEGNTQITNVSTLALGDHVVKCIATKTSNGKTSAEKQVTIKVVEKPLVLKDAILGASNSKVLANGANQTWTTSWQSSDASGLYAQTVGSNKTYYFRGNPTNNYIKFAGKDYRILRVNEDGTIRIMLTSSIGSNKFNSTYNTYDKMYYTNSELKTVVDNWFTTNITGDNASKVVSGNYFCEQAKVVWNTSKYTAGSATVTAKESYTPTFECTTDGNGKGVVTSKVGLVTYDETIYAGGWYYVSGLSYPYYLNSGSSYWTMSHAGFYIYNNAYAWNVRSDGYTLNSYVTDTHGVRPVLNLSADTLVSGSGTKSDPYIVK